MPGSRRKHPLDKTESFHCSSGCIPIRIIKNKKGAMEQLHEISFNAIESLRNNQKQLNENTAVTMEKFKGRLTILLGKEKLLNKRQGGNKSYFEMQKNDNLSPHPNSIAENTYHKQKIKTLILRLISRKNLKDMPK